MNEVLTLPTHDLYVKCSNGLERMMLINMLKTLGVPLFHSTQKTYIEQLNELDDDACWLSWDSGDNTIFRPAPPRHDTPDHCIATSIKEFLKAFNYDEAIHVVRILGACNFLTLESFEFRIAAGYSAEITWQQLCKIHQLMCS